jgi:hypothetical protein
MILMVSLIQRTLVGQATETQRSGVLVHPTGEIVLLYSISSPNAGDAFLDYCTEQFEHEHPSTSLELHQLLERCISTAERMEVGLSLAGVGTIEGRVILAAYQGVVWLKRGMKSGQILSAENSLQILEGNTQPDDVYVLLTKSAQQLQEVLHVPLEKVSPQNAGELIELAAVRSAVTGASEEAGIGITVIMIKEAVAAEDRKHSAASAPLDHPTALTPSEIETARAEKPSSPLQSAMGFVTTFVTTLAGLGKSIQNEVEQVFSQDIYVRRQKRRSLGKILIIVVAILFAAGGVFAFVRNHQAEQRKQLLAVIQPYEIRFGTARDEARQNPVIARQHTEELIADLETQTQSKETPKFIAEALTVQLEKVRTFYDSISGQEEFPELQPYYDLRLVQSNFLASKIDITADTLFFLDSGQRRILALNIERKQPTILPIGEYPDIRAVIADDKYLYFLAQGLFRFTLSGTDVANIVENADDIINSSQSLGVFGSYVYVLNKPQNNIFRYTTNDDQLDSKPTAWIQPGQGIDLNTVQSFAIDGDIWLATQSGEIKKLTSGREVEFTVTGLKEAFSSPITLFTKPDLANLYVLEPEKSRVVVLNKKGEFLKEVKSSSLAGSTAVVASEKSQKAFALSGSLVFEIGL